jgi:uncharacterized protein (TIGR02996 family)
MGSHQSSETEAFEAGLLDHPDDIARWSAYSDYLSERGDPRGEFMRVQLALEDESLSPADRQQLKDAEAELLQEHERDWLGPLAAFTVDAKEEERWHGVKDQNLPSVVHEFERGWLRRLEFFYISVAQARALAACPDARLLRDLRVGDVINEAPEGTEPRYSDSCFPRGPDVPEGVDEYEGPALHALCHCPQLAAVQSFILGYGQNEVCRTPGYAAHQLVARMPRVEEIDLSADSVDTDQLFALPMPSLRSLSVFHLTDYPLDKLAANPSLTSLHTLLCHPHALRLDGRTSAYIGLPELRAICRSPYLTSLTHLCLRVADFGDAGIDELIDSGMFQRLKSLDLRAGCVSDNGAYRLIASPHLRKLQFLNLQNNALSDAAATALMATGVNVNLSEQHTDTFVDPNADQSPEFLFDGDIE